MKGKLEILVSEANSGNKESLELLIIEIKDMIYNLSLKMLLFTEDAKDATQEILVKIITHLSTFEGNSQFTTWAYRVATNYLLTARAKKTSEFALPFEDYERLIDTGQSDQVLYTENEGELLLLEEEVKVSCTHGLLLCLDETNRMVYILAEILELNSIEGAEILDITPENFRQKLSRSRFKIRNFLQKKCGLVNSKNPCRCTRKIDFLINQDAINPNKLQYAHLTNRSIDLIDKIDHLEKSIGIYRSVPHMKAPGQVMNRMKKIIKISI